MKQRKTEHPILMCGEMVRAILAGTKTETRRMAGLKELNKKHDYCFVFRDDYGDYYEISEHRKPIRIKHPYGVAGDTLWVRETWQALTKYNHVRSDDIKLVDTHHINYVARGITWDARIRPSIHMPRWASRITLTVKCVTLERLHEITDEGARAEGVENRAEYERLWKEINGLESWDNNPWVWVVKFDVKEVRK